MFTESFPYEVFLTQRDFIRVMTGKQSRMDIQHWIQDNI